MSKKCNGIKKGNKRLCQHPFHDKFKGKLCSTINGCRLFVQAMADESETLFEKIYFLHFCLVIKFHISIIFSDCGHH